MPPPSEEGAVGAVDDEGAEGHPSGRLPTGSAARCPRNQYKDVILGMVFLKYVSDAYDERREGIRADLTAEGYDEEQIADLIDNPEEYQGVRGVRRTGSRALVLFG